jgi:hypothetical protein
METRCVYNLPKYAMFIDSWHNAVVPLIPNAMTVFNTAALTFSLVVRTVKEEGALCCSAGAQGLRDVLLVIFLFLVVVFFV